MCEQGSGDIGTNQSGRGKDGSSDSIHDKRSMSDCVPIDAPQNACIHKDALSGTHLMEGGICTQVIHQQGACIGACDCPQSIKHHGEVRARHELFEQAKVEDLLQHGTVVLHAVDDLHLPRTTAHHMLLKQVCFLKRLRP